MPHFVRPRPARVEWYGPQVLAGIRRLSRQRLDAVGQQLVAAVRQNIATPSPPPSSAGDFPHRESGELSASVRSTPVTTGRQQGVIIEATAPHALPLEMGTATMAPRPFLRRTVEEQAPSLARLFASPAGAGTWRGLLGKLAQGISRFFNW